MSSKNEIDPHQPGAKLDQDKDRWDLLMDFAFFEWDKAEPRPEDDDSAIRAWSVLEFTTYMLNEKDHINLEAFNTYHYIFHVVKVATYGAKKYTDGGWLSVPNGIRRYRAAAIRHRIAMETEENDRESGLPHAWHVEWNLWAVYTLEQKQSENQGES